MNERKTRVSTSVCPDIPSQRIKIVLYDEHFIVYYCDLQRREGMCSEGRPTAKDGLMKTTDLDLAWETHIQHLKVSVYIDIIFNVFEEPGSIPIKLTSHI